MNKIFFPQYYQEGKKYTLPYRHLEVKFSKEQLLKEFNKIVNSKGDFTRPCCNNKITLTYQSNFYKVENNLWKDPIIREKLITNRMKYLNSIHGKESVGMKDPESLNDKEILRGFKISGIHTGFSHHSSFWIKAFIEKYNIKSIYDPCGGWGHRLLGAWNIDYIYNDIDKQTTNNVKRIYEDFNKNILFNNTKKVFYSNDSNSFIPIENYNTVFTCPPYFDIELYNGKDTSTKKYSNYLDWLNVWWRNTIKCSIKNSTKYFVFIINNQYKDDMNKICLEEGLRFIEEIYVGKNAKNHFQRTAKNSYKSESLQIFRIN